MLHDEEAVCGSPFVTSHMSMQARVTRCFPTNRNRATSYIGLAITAIALSPGISIKVQPGSSGLFFVLVSPALWD